MPLGTLSAHLSNCGRYSTGFIDPDKGKSEFEDKKLKEDTR
ncbi:hypothetical protein [Methanosarcina sp.]|jgi:hypothetical protein|nr:hypothetical protein [Methanosarcina sp.]HOW15126.1 hypothetical protein [Methanosarcina sp.]